MSDIAILSDPLSFAFLMLIFGAPGIPVGAIIGALAWRSHRVWGAALGAAVGFEACLGGVWIWMVN
jgi:hypothetical protein